MEQTELEFSHVDVVAIATAAAQLDSRLTTAEVLVTFGALLVPEPAWYARSVFTTALRLFDLHELRFTKYFPRESDRHLMALQASVDALDSGNWATRPHLLQPPPTERNPFKGRCLGSAPLYSAIGLVSEEQPQAFSPLLVESIAAGMAYIRRTCAPQQYLSALEAGTTPIPRDASRLQGGERALRWLSSNCPAALVQALGDGLAPGGIAQRVVQRPPALQDARRHLSHNDSIRFDELERFLKMVVLGQKPHLKVGHSGAPGPGLGGGFANKGRYEFLDTHLVATGGRDFVDDDPELPVQIVNIGQPDEHHEDGEAPIEGVPPNEIALVRPDSDDRPLDALILAAKQRASLIERGNQALPFGWGTSTRFEIDSYASLAWEESEEAEPELWRAAICALLATGCTVDALSEIRWSSGREPWRNGIEYDLSRAEWLVPGRTPAFKHVNSEASTDAMIEPLSHVRLPDYWRFARFFAGDHSELSRRKLVFKTDIAQIKASARAGLSHYNRQGLRLSLERCANVLPQLLYQQTQDVGPLANIITDSSWHSATVAHYQTSPVELIRRCYRLAQYRISSRQVAAWDKQQSGVTESPSTAAASHPPSTEPEYCGAAHHPKISELATRISRMKDSLLTAATTSVGHSTGPGGETTDQRIEFHNLFVQYVAGWQMFETAMRAIRDPSPQLVDRVTNYFAFTDGGGNRKHWIAYISDKQRGTRYLDRLVSLSDNLISQLAEWDRHARQMRYLACAGGFEPTEHVYFVMGANGAPSELKPSHFSESGFELPYRINALRRLVRSHLSAAGVNGEIIDAYLGHGRRGTERWNKYSTLSMAEVVDIAAPHLSDLRERLGWSVVRSPYAR